MSSMRVTLRQLSSFEAVARLNSFSRAAEEMHVSQPTVSKQIKQLQEAVGLPLLEQIGKRVFLTDAGKLLFETAHGWLNTWGRFEQSIANLKGLKEGRLRIASVTTSKYFIPRILGPFCAKYPQIDVSMEVVNRDRLLERLHHNDDDIYIMGVPPKERDIEAEALFENPLVLIAHPAHSLAKEKNIPFARLGEELFLSREFGSGTRIATEKIFAANNTPLNIRIELGSNEALKQAVAGGLGLAVVSGSTLSHNPANDGLVLLDVQGFPIKRNWFVVRPKGKQLSVVASTFLEFLRSHVELLQRS